MRRRHVTLWKRPWHAPKCPLVVSVQAPEGTPLHDPDTLLRSAQASLEQGVEILRLEGVETIKTIKLETNARTIGLIKRRYGDSDVYITPTSKEVKELLELPCDFIAMDATDRKRPFGENFYDLVAMAHEYGRGVMADCDTVESAIEADRAGADIISSTLSGYTEATAGRSGPDLDFIRTVAAALKSKKPKRPPHNKPPLIFAEGRYSERWQIEAALHCGADAVVVGGAINDPIKNTQKLLPTPPVEGPIGVIDVGGTWLRIGETKFGRSPGAIRGFVPVRPILRERLPQTRQGRLELISSAIKGKGFVRIGISSAGVIWNNVVTLSKKFIPENQGTDYNVLRHCLEGDDPIGVIALGDGHAAAWAHACHPDFAGKDIVVLAIGTGLGFGHVRKGKIVMGTHGEYSRLNDLPGPGNKTFEQLLGGAALTPNPSDEQKAMANAAVEHAIRMVSTFLFPDVIVLCGTVGMQPWLNVDLPEKEGWPSVPVVRSPFGADAGLYGAAALALFPPEL